MEAGDDPYQILGVNTTATTSEIRKAYRSLAVKHHPDKQPTEEGREKAHHVFARIACAYELLSDDFTRKEYDNQQKEAEEEAAAGHDNDGDDDDDDDSSFHAPGFDGNATYDYPFQPTRNAGSTALVTATEKTGKGGFNPFRKKKKKKPMHFSDPYEVFKRAFKEEFGYEYPGAKWDNIKPTGKDVHQRAKNAPLALQNGGQGDNDDGSGKKKKGGGILTMFKKKDTALTVYNEKKAKGGKGGKDKSAYKKPEGNNRPSAMETKTTKVEHDDGTTETITETTITRPDGSTETMRSTDMPEKKTHDWTPPKEGGGGGKGGKDLKKLTNGGKEKQKMLTNGGSGKKSAKKDKKKLAITNG